MRAASMPAACKGLRRSSCISGLTNPSLEFSAMFKKIVPVVIGALFVAGPVLAADTTAPASDSSASAPAKSSSHKKGGHHKKSSKKSTTDSSSGSK